ncbi:hypothetical protein HOLleu_42760 [Holothuria leucospilota]|uniref:Uncharacterized protein n=1 Tax=Holothuria leucospilota TaxID=206669 RepID=A0A9Q1B9Z6_HOLLE|nr:hypothetical protein HOLleu_42760 [Holothuria leucospilota]
MWKYFTYRNTLKYIDILPNLVKGYNHSYHRSIKMCPVEVTKDNENQVWRTLYRPGINIKASFKYKVGDKVRISKTKLKFEKGYLPNWSEEIFTIVKRKAKPVPVYKLSDWGGEPIEEHQRVGDTHVPLLRVVRIGTRKAGEHTSIVKGNWIQYHPLTNITDTGPIQFTVQGSIDDYIDLSQTILHVRAKIVQGNGEDIENDANVGPANLMLQTLFSEVDVSLNDRLVTPSTNTYPYRAILETLLSYGPDAKESQLTGSLFYKDTPGKMDSCNPNAVADVVNHGLRARTQYTRNSNTVDLVGPIHCDLFFQEKILLGGVELKLKLHRSKNEFCLLSSQADADFKVRIVEASIFMRHVKVHPQVALGHAKALERGTAKYPIRRAERLVIGCVDSEAFNGSYNRNPFNFHHHDLNFIALYVDGEQLPWKPLRPNFGDGQYIMAYQTLFSGLNTMFSDKGNHINRNDYGHGYTLYAFDMTPDLANGGHFNLRKNGNVRLEMQFDRALVRTVNVIVYAEYDAIVEIDKTRVFPSDCLPSECFSFPCAFIANTDKADEPGSHWVAMYFDDNVADFFDSFGRTPEECSPYFEHFLKKHSNIIQWNQKRLQGFMSTVCGQYCLFYLLHRCRNLSMNTIISKFTEDPTFNDSLVNDFITKRYNLDLKVGDDEYIVLQIARQIADKYY